jgi:hypothetical protein
MKSVLLHDHAHACITSSHTTIPMPASHPPTRPCPCLHHILPHDHPHACITSSHTTMPIPASHLPTRPCPFLHHILAHDHAHSCITSSHTTIPISASHPPTRCSCCTAGAFAADALEPRPGQRLVVFTVGCRVWPRLWLCSSSVSHLCVSRLVSEH